MNVNICVVPAYFQKLRCILRGPIFQDNVWQNFHGIEFRLQQGLHEYFTKLLLSKNKNLWFSNWYIYLFIIIKFLDQSANNA